MGDVEKAVLRALRGKTTVHMRELVRETGISVGRILRAIDELEKRGLIRSFRHGGYSFFSLTEEGEREASRAEVSIPPLGVRGPQSREEAGESAEAGEQPGDVEGGLGDGDSGGL